MNQTKTFGPITFLEYGKRFIVKAEVQLQNGVLTIMPTIENKDGDTPKEHFAGGGVWTVLAKQIPEVAPAIKWHLVGDPMKVPGKEMAWVHHQDSTFDMIPDHCIRYMPFDQALEFTLRPAVCFNYVSLAGCRYERDMRTSLGDPEVIKDLCRTMAQEIQLCFLELQYP